MKIGVLADSHDNMPKIEAAVEIFARYSVEHVLHAGDFVAPFAIDPLRALGCRMLAVFGNNDGERLGLAARIRDFGEVHDYLATATLGGRRIAIVHYPELAEPLSRSGDFDLVVYGHTHKVDYHKDDTLLLNPGEVGGWLSGISTVAIVELETLEVEILEV